MLPQVRLSRPLQPFQLEIDPYLTATKDIRVLVTGGASGIGLSIAHAYAAAGAYVTLLDLNAEEAEIAAEGIRASGCYAQPMAADVTSWSSLSTAFRSAMKYGPLGQSPRLDHVVACAGVMGQPIFPPPSQETPSLTQIPVEPDLCALDVNAKGLIYTVRLAQYYMSIPPSPAPPISLDVSTPIPNTGSKTPVDEESNIVPDKAITLVSSTGAYWPVPLADVYNASKGAVRCLFHTIRGPFAERGIRVNMIAPWLMKTPMSLDSLPVLEAAGYPAYEPGLVARAAMHLAADRAIAGRVLQAGLGGLADMRDDEEGLHGGVATKELIEKWLGGYRGLEFRDEKIMVGFGYKSADAPSSFDELKVGSEEAAKPLAIP